MRISHKMGIVRNLPLLQAARKSELYTGGLIYCSFTTIVPHSVFKCCKSLFLNRLYYLHCTNAEVNISSSFLKIPIRCVLC
ncbi:hypothetical protein FKM82_007068 [Ascaphus truei]